MSIVSFEAFQDADEDKLLLPLIGRRPDAHYLQPVVEDQQRSWDCPSARHYCLTRELSLLASGC